MATLVCKKFEVYLRDRDNGLIYKVPCMITELEMSSPSAGVVEGTIVLKMLAAMEMYFEDDIDHYDELSATTNYLN